MKIDNRTAAGYLKALSGLEQLPGPNGQRYIELFHHGTLSIELYAPRGNDPQTPHARDEIYVIIQGNGGFVRGEQQTTFNTGDVLFVPAGMEHRFVDFTDDFATWVFFYGPEGGEASVQP
jgi:mannose-6-phosphate isomerase-like protein (cupin superfamily)